MDWLLLAKAKLKCNQRTTQRRKNNEKHKCTCKRGLNMTKLKPDLGSSYAIRPEKLITSIPVSYTHLTLPTNREV